MENVVGSLIALYVIGGLLSAVRAIIIYSGEKDTADVSKILAGLFILLLAWPLEFKTLWME